jgi:hypothetical protein
MFVLVLRPIGVFCVRHVDSAKPSLPEVALKIRDHLQKTINIWITVSI